ncbi:hypothetical protein EV426DRAFT_665694 [Tirmania nivea]|nr:hypothetical protein EV426DRAFT_665694 [Tirmania nivea]
MESCLLLRDLLIWVFGASLPSVVFEAGWSQQEKSLQEMQYEYFEPRKPTLSSLATVDPTAWVGPLRVWLEVWRYDDEARNAYLDNNKRWSVLDEWPRASSQATQSNGTILDIFPHALPTHVPQASMERRLILDLDLLRMGILRAKPEYVLRREITAAAKIYKELGLQGGEQIL